MINHFEARLSQVSVHHIPQAEMSSGPRFSDAPFHFDNEEMKEALLKLFFGSFKEPEYFKFSHLEENSNVLYSLAKMAFDNPSAIHELSVEMAQHLYKQSNHPNIKPGDFIVSLVEDVLIDDEMLTALVLVKSETKQSFLKVREQHNSQGLQLDRGMPLNKLDKACIIFNTEAEQGYKCCIIDKSSGGEEAVFWRKYFLDVERQFNDYQKTKVYIQATKGFIDERLKPLYDVEKQDEAQLLNLSKDFFKSNEDFEEATYLDSLFGDQEEIKDEFKSYRHDYEEQQGHALYDNFKVSQAAVKNQNKVFKSVIKLDKNFHIYIHGNREMIEKGTDEMGRKYYKLYFDNEA